jgi:hypothetical protein
MKAIVISFIVLFSVVSLYGQPVLTIVVAPFDINDRSVSMEAEMIRDAFIERLDANTRVRLIGTLTSDRFFTDAGFTKSDWTSNHKTTELGDAMGVDWIVRGIYEKQGFAYLLGMQFYSVRRNAFVGGGDVVVNGLYDAFGRLNMFVDEALSTIQRPRPTGGNMLRMARRSNSDLGIEVRTNSAGTLYFEDDESIMLQAGDTCFIPINSSGTFDIKMVFRDGHTDSREVTFDAIRMTREFFYHLGGVGQAGGIVFYDKGFYSDGWRYMEVSQGDYRGRWAAFRNVVSGTSAEVGSGKKNTVLITNEISINRTADIFRNEIKIGGYFDWFLPSIDELMLVHQNLHLQMVGEFEPRFYWSSSQQSASAVMGINFGDGSRSISEQDNEHLFRPIRSF